jgi:hypothetical protein
MFEKEELIICWDIQCLLYAGFFNSKAKFWNKEYFTVEWILEKFCGGSIIKRWHISDVKRHILFSMMQLNLCNSLDWSKGSTYAMSWTEINQLSCIKIHMQIMCQKKEIYIINNYSPCQIRTIVYRRPVTGRLECFGNFGRIHYRIHEGGHLPSDGSTEPGLVCLALDT